MKAEGCEQISLVNQSGGKALKYLREKKDRSMNLTTLNLNNIFRRYIVTQKEKERQSSR